MRVVIGEDQALLRQGVVRLLEDAGFEVVAQAGDAPDLLRKVAAHKPDVAIVDVQMPPAELATIRLLGGTAGQATRMVALELAPVMLTALVAGAAIAGVAMIGVPGGVRGIPLVVPAVVVGGLLAGTVALGLAAGAVTARIALRASPASAMRAQE